ncbi:hypothetical protein, partial [Nocardioides zeicaulis]
DATAPGDAPTTTASGLVLPAPRGRDDYSTSDPPRFHVLAADGQLDLAPWTICYASGCADGGPSDTPPPVGAPPELTLGFDLPGWTFQATFREHGTRAGCGRQVTVPVEATGERTFRVLPAGPSGDWDVDLFGRGPTGGDAVTTVRWRTPVEGAYPDAATGQASVLADDDGELDSYGLELFVSDLDRDHPEARAEVVVTSASGRSVTLPLGAPDECHSEGFLSFRAPAALGRRATVLGEGPFAYEVRLVLAGTTYTGRGTWPDDTTEEITPAVPLTWTPALPVYRG